MSQSTTVAESAIYAGGARSASAIYSSAVCSLLCAMMTALLDSTCANGLHRLPCRSFASRWSSGGQPAWSAPQPAGGSLLWPPAGQPHRVHALARRCRGGRGRGRVCRPRCGRCCEKEHSIVFTDAGSLRVVRASHEPRPPTSPRCWTSSTGGGTTIPLPECWPTPEEFNRPLSTSHRPDGVRRHTVVGPGSCCTTTTPTDLGGTMRRDLTSAMESPEWIRGVYRTREVSACGSECTVLGRF
jgi:hypothetical protein